jgi:acetate kinase
MTNENVLAKGLIERIGTKNALVKQTTLDGREFKGVEEIPNHEKGIEIIIKTLLDLKYGAINNIKEIEGVGHRVVHGGDKFSTSVLIDDAVKQKIKDCIDLAPLHNPNNLKGIEAMENILPHVKQTASFDTAFHQTLPDYAFLYGLPYKYYQEEGIRRYGFHGTSHKFITKKTSDILQKDLKDLNIITCHLGNGGSVTAVKNGKSVDTSMGFTPLEGLIMGTRSGDIDPAIIFYLATKMDMSLCEIDDMLNKYSGVLGISGISNDMREIVTEIQNNNKRAILAMQMYAYKIKKYIGSYLAVLNGCDAIVFTGGIGENNKVSREMICSDFENLGICLDKVKNDETILGREGFISSEKSKIKILVLSTDEELVIARDARDIIQNKI